MNKFLLFLVIVVCFLGSLFLFGRDNRELKRDYLIFWLKSSFFTSLIFFILMVMVKLEEFLEADSVAFLAGYAMCLGFSLLFMGGATFSLYSRKK